jgi:hypothetical protein
MSQNLIINAGTFGSSLVITTPGKHDVIPGFTRIPATFLETYSHARMCADGKEEVMCEISRYLIVRTFTIGTIVKFHDLVVREDRARRGVI